MAIFQVLVFHGVFLAFIALLVRFAGNNSILAGSNESGIKDLAKLNRWAGNRLLLLPVLAFAMAQLSLGSIGAGILGLMLLWAGIFSVIIWISVGAKKLAN